MYIETCQGDKNILKTNLDEAGKFVFIRAFAAFNFPFFLPRMFFKIHLDKNLSDSCLFVHSWHLIFLSFCHECSLKFI